jgi:hypothetical protein
MSGNSSTKSLALLVSNDNITFLTKTDQHDEIFYSEPSVIKILDQIQTQPYEKIENEIKSNLPLLLYYNKVIVCYQSTPVVVVPKAHFNADTNFSLNNEVKLNFTELPQHELVVSYGNFGALDKVLKNLPNFAQAEFTHSAKAFIENVNVNKEKIQVFAQLIHQKLELCIYNKGIFTLYNIYDIIGDEDVVYHILNTIQQLQLDPLHVAVSFEGGVATSHIAFDHLPKYVHQVTSNKEADLQGPKYLLYKIFECE